MCITEYDEVKTMNMFREEGREEGRLEGRMEGREEGRSEEQLSSIRKLMKTLKLTAQQAMDVLEIPPSDQKFFLAML